MIPNSKQSSSVWKFFLALIAIGTMTGCQLLPHALQPSQLHKLNRGPELGRDTYNFSIKDPEIPTADNGLGNENTEAMSRALSDQPGGLDP